MAKRYATHVTTPSGQRVYISGTSKKEFSEKLFSARVSLHAGVDISDDTLFRDYAEMWWKTYKIPLLRESSRQLGRSILDLHVLPILGDIVLRDLKPMHVQAMLSTLRKNNASKSLQAKCIGTVRQILRSAMENGLISKIPISSETKPTGETKRDETPLTREQSVKLMQAVKGTRAEMFVWLALATGLRRGELCALMWSDVDLAKGLIHVRHNKAFAQNQNDAPITEMLKTDAARRDIPISGDLLTALKTEKLKSKSQFVIPGNDGQSMSRSSIRAMMRIIEARTATEDKPLGTKLCGVEVTLDFPVHPHLLRHTCITRWAEAGMDLKQMQYLAGHSSIEMTMRVYAHYMRGERENETRAKMNDAAAFLVG